MHLILIFIAAFLISSFEAANFFDKNYGIDEDDSFDCNDGKKVNDPVLVPFLEKLGGEELIPSTMKDWIIFFDEENEFSHPELDNFNEGCLTEKGLSECPNGTPQFGKIFCSEEINIYYPKVTSNMDQVEEFRKMYAEELLFDAIDRLKLVVRWKSDKNRTLSASGNRMLQKITKRSDLKMVYVISSGKCGNACRERERNPVKKLATCGAAYGKKIPMKCVRSLSQLFNADHWAKFSSGTGPEFQLVLPMKLKRDFHKTMDFLLKRIADRMVNYMELAFAKNRFAKSPTDLYHKVDLQISKIRGSKIFQASKSAHFIYKTLFELNEYLNVTNTPYTFDKLLSFSHYLEFIGRFSNWPLDVTKYANFFEPLKETCMDYLASENIFPKRATKLYEEDEDVYDLTGTICHDNILYIIYSQVTMQTIKSGLYDSANCDFHSIFVFGKLNFTINENLRLPGKNLIVFSPVWEMAREHTIDLSGKRGKIEEEGARGGDFFGYGTKFINSKYLTIISNGGDGGQGRIAESVKDGAFFKWNRDKCTPLKTNQIIEEYGASYGARGGSRGSVSLKFVKNQNLNATLITEDGIAGEDAIMTNLSVNCGGLMRVTVPVTELVRSNVQNQNNADPINEPEVFHLLWNLIRKNSHRLSYQVLAFFKTVWTFQGLGLDFTLGEFLNSSGDADEYDSRKFYEIASEILHAQIKNNCHKTESSRHLFDFALTTIRMESPIHGVLPSIINIDPYLKEVIQMLGENKIKTDYFRRKEERFSKIIQEANNYLNISLLPSISATIESNNKYLHLMINGKVKLTKFGQFEEYLVMNSLLRLIRTIFEHVHFTLNDFAISPRKNLNGKINSESMENKMYFFKFIRNNITVNEMNAMRQLLQHYKNELEKSVNLREKCRSCRSFMTKVQKRNAWNIEPEVEDCFTPDGEQKENGDSDKKNNEKSVSKQSKSAPKLETSFGKYYDTCYPPKTGNAWTNRLFHNIFWKRRSNNFCGRQLLEECTRLASPNNRLSFFHCVDNCNTKMVDPFMRKLSTEIKACGKDEKFDYKKIKSACFPNESDLFNVKGCDPETLLRIYREIRSNFLQKYLENSPNLASIKNAKRRHFANLVIYADLILSEGMTLAENTMERHRFLTTKAFINYLDLKADFESEVINLHEFSESDIYDLFTAQSNMQNERLDITSRWLSQVKKLIPWMRNVAEFLGTNDDFRGTNERIFEGMRIVAEIGHSVKVVEHYRHLREYVQDIDEIASVRSTILDKFKPVLEKTFAADIFKKAVKIAENWMFPLTKSVQELRDALARMKNDTYSVRIGEIAKQIGKHRQSMTLYTSRESLPSEYGKNLFYKWNIRIRPTLIEDLFNRKPVILVSEILDGGMLNSLAANRFEFRFVANNNDDQKELDDALADTWLQITHAGISYFKFGSRIYRRLTEAYTFRQSAVNTSGNDQFSSDLDFVLSPYTTWILRFQGELPDNVKEKIGSINLYGSGRYVVNCAEIPQLSQYFIPLTDYQRRNRN